VRKRLPEQIEQRMQTLFDAQFAAGPGADQPGCAGAGG